MIKLMYQHIILAMNKKFRRNFKIVWLLLVMQSALLCYAQPERIDPKFMDSILPLFKDMPADTVKVNSLKRFSSMIVFSNPDSAILLSRQADSLAVNLNYNFGRIFCLGNIAWTYASMGERAKAIYEAKKAIPIAEKYHPRELIYVNNLLFFVNAYGIGGDMEKAMVWVQKNVQSSYFKALPDTIKWPTYLQLGLGYSAMKQIDSAKYYANILLTLMDKNSSNNPLAHETYMLCGNIQMMEKNYTQALKYYSLAPYEIGLAQVYQAIGKTDSVIKYANMHLQIGQQARNPTIIMEGSKLLADEYANIDIRETNKFLNIYIAASDSLNSTEKQKQIEQLRFTEQLNEFELKTRDAANRNRIIQVLFISILSFFAVFSYLLWRNNKFKQKANQKLEDSYADLKAAQSQLIQSEKMASLGELTAGIAHEIQNPLNFVNNFSEVNAELSDEMLEAVNKGDLSAIKGLASDIKSNQEKISEHGKRADAIVKGMLQHSRSSSGEKQPTDINALADEYLRLSYHGLRAKDKNFNAALKTEFDPAVGKINIVSQDIGRVLLNLYNNAFYAVNEKSRETVNSFEAEVTVSTRLVSANENPLIRKSANSLIILIKDNGNGIPQNIQDKIFQPFFTTKPTGQGTGLGLSLSYDIVKAHGGKLSVVTIEGQGTTFTIEIPYT
jgi:two-component system, NtrC family, sensor kinase